MTPRLPKLLIYLTINEASSRLQYTLDIICEWFGWNWTFAQNESDLQSTLVKTEGCCGVLLYYRPYLSEASANTGSVSIFPAGLLEQTRGSTAWQPRWEDYQGIPNPAGADPLAGIFFCLSLYAEYSDVVRDTHGRFPAGAHPLVQKGVAHRAIADELARAFANELWRAAGLEGQPQMRLERAHASIDIDSPRALKGKPFVRKNLALLRGILGVVKASRATEESLHWPEVLSWASGQNDPYDTFDYIVAQVQRHQLVLDAFSLVGYDTTLDPGWPVQHELWGEFWRKLNRQSRLGIHPSYKSSERLELISKEKSILEQAIQQDVTISRQHFLRFALPTTFRELVACGIEEDHSLAWAEMPGFRAGTAKSFKWYDLERETTSELLLVPPHYMDVTARYYQGLTPKLAIESCRKLASEAKLSQTGLRMIWHNSNLGVWHGWLPWREVFEKSLDLTRRP